MFEIYHRQISVGGEQLHVDLSIDQGLGIGMKVLTNLRHLQIDKKLSFFRSLKDLTICSITHRLCEQIFFFF
jgi:hypothetical protein